MCVSVRSMSIEGYSLFQWCALISCWLALTEFAVSKLEKTRGYMMLA